MRNTSRAKQREASWVGGTENAIRKTKWTTAPLETRMTRRKVKVQDVPLPNTPAKGREHKKHRKGPPVDEDSAVRRLRNGKECRTDAITVRGRRRAKTKRPGIPRIRLRLSLTAPNVVSPTTGAQPHPLAVDVLQQQLRREKAEHENTKNLLAQSLEELRSAHVFLDQADVVAREDVLSITSQLNYAILQAATSIADSVILSAEQTPKTGQDAQWFSNARDQLKGRIGSALVCKLDEIWPGNNSPIGQDATWVQYAIQSYLVKFCANFLSDSGYSQEGEIADFTGIYEHICARLETTKGPHAIAGRWRSLTYKALRAQEPHRYRPLPFTDYILGVISEILLGIGAWDSAQDNKSFSKTFRDSIKDLVVVLFRLDLTIKEDFITADILPLTAAPESQYDPDLMEDESGLAENGSTVVSSLTLGLQTKSRRGEGGEHVDVILKPKVIVDAVMNM